MTTLEKAAYLIEAQSKCSHIAQTVLHEPTARAYCSPRWAPFDNVHVTIREDMAANEEDLVAYFDSEDESQCWGDPIPNTGALLSALRAVFPGVSLSIAVCA